MAFIRTKNDKYHICWYDRNLKKHRSKSTGLKATTRNKKKANKMLQEFEQKLSDRNDSISVETSNMMRKTIKDAIEHFIKINKNKNKKTIVGYRHFFNKFIDGKHFSLVDSVSKISKTSVEQWLLSIDTGKYQQNTLYGISKNLNKFLNFLFEYNYAQVFKINKDLKFKPEQKDILIFEEDDIELMFKHLPEKNDNFKIMFYLLFYTGLRPSDIIDIKKKDICFEHHTIKYYSRKTGQHNHIPVTVELTQALIPLLKEKQQEDRILEYSRYENIAKAVNRYLTELGLKSKGYNARTFRKTFISLAYANGVDYVTTSAIVGHKSILTTKRYYTKLSLSNTQKEVNKIKFHAEGSNGMTEDKLKLDEQ